MPGKAEMAELFAICIACSVWLALYLSTLPF